MATFLSRFIGSGNESSHQAAAGKPRLALESLETREVPSATASLVPGGGMASSPTPARASLVVQGTLVDLDQSGSLLIRQTEGTDSAKVYLGSGGRIRVDVNGVFAREFLPSLVTRIDYFGLGGDDTYRNFTWLPSGATGGAGNDTLVGGWSSDTLVGGADNDRLFGNLGNDFLHGEGGNDQLHGEAGRDRLEGGANDDILNGGRGEPDHLEGGEGSDTFVYDEGRRKRGLWPFRWNQYFNIDEPKDRADEDFLVQ